MRPEVVAVGDEAPDDGLEFRRPVEIAGEEEARLDALVAEDPADVLAAVGERPAGEDEGHPAEGRVGPDDAVVVAEEDPAGVGGGPAAGPPRQDAARKAPTRARPAVSHPAAAARRRAGPGPGHFSAARTFQPLILTTGSSPPRSSVLKRPEILRVSFGRSVM